MRILTGIDVPFNPFGGSPIITNDWYSNLPCDSEVLFLTMLPTSCGKWWSMGNVRFLKTEKERDTKGYQKYIQSLNKEVSTAIDTFKPDILHLQHINFGLSRSFCEVGGDLPKITFCHGTDVQYALKSEFFMENLKYIACSSDILIFPTKNMMSDFKKVYGWKFRYEIIPHGIPKDVFCEHRIHNRSKTLKLIYAGRLNSYKGADIAIEAVGRARIPCILDIFGKEDELGYLNELKSICLKLGIEKRVHFYDQVERSMLWRLFSNYDAILIPSRRLEAFSITSIEAQARGLVVVYGNGGGIVDVIGRSGIKIRDNLPEELSRILESLVWNPRKLDKYRKLGYSNACKYRLEDQIKKIMLVSRKLLIRGLVSHRK